MVAAAAAAAVAQEAAAAAMLVAAAVALGGGDGCSGHGCGKDGSSIGAGGSGGSNSSGGNGGTGTGCSGVGDDDGGDGCSAGSRAAAAVRLRVMTKWVTLGLIRMRMQASTLLLGSCGGQGKTVSSSNIPAAVRGFGGSTKEGSSGVGVGADPGIAALNVVAFDVLLDNRLGGWIRKSLEWDKGFP